ncbi:ribosome biogenesis GTP-binding protein YihA/YsxC [Draconibacterium sp. IB214405]|uniref:ribosome biogenesis GTP-binding protein YihA/YsxC n=1 Tax=Draconibacterium sp. IB214405 TaxID=3097352 RepID=UPI002A0E5669|nr:ribosome biogenesis GTP-binding protein YihA/YsxC [Draconibacterium sp. IB214405]MDX8341019.1 ribosome biogenesis GTP-binding protein YihA/YsxC [Draconibacterium sp. IB214405]
MEIKEAQFVMSNTEVEKCPAADRPEYAFIGRSNVGKSSLINMLTNKKSLAKTSGKPGKTRLINHFLIDKTWYLVDLPGYGYASVPKAERLKWEKMLKNYILKRENLYCLFVLIDSRHEAQKVDLEFMEWLGISGIPFNIIFTKADKLKPSELEANLKAYEAKMFETWETMPGYFVSSSEKVLGKDEILAFIDDVNNEEQ